MRKISFSSILLVFLSLITIWLTGEVMFLKPDNTAYMQNIDSGYAPIRTIFGIFPVSIVSNKTTNDRTELSVVLINPLNIHFADAQISADVNGTVETVTMNLIPSANKIKFKVPPIQVGDPVTIRLELNRVYIK